MGDAFCGIYILSACRYGLGTFVYILLIGLGSWVTAAILERFSVNTMVG